MDLRSVDANAYMLGYGWVRLLSTTYQAWFEEKKESPEVYFDIVKAVAEKMTEEGEETSAGAGKEETQQEDEGSQDGRPPLCWSYQYCPNCVDDVELEWLSFREFARRCKKKDVSPKDRKTVSRREDNAKYWANADHNVPWCPECEEMTPKGEGRQQPVGQRDALGFNPSDAELKDMMTWVGEIVQNEWPSFSVSGNPEDKKLDASKAFQRAMEECAEWMDGRAEMLSRDEVEHITHEAVDEVKKEQNKRRYSPDIDIEETDWDSSDIVC